VARLAITERPPLVDPAAYHCQQAVEKLFKALPGAIALPVPRTHDVAYFAELLAPAYPDLATQIGTLAWLSPWATTTRYPSLDDEGAPTTEDVQQAMAEIAALIATIEGQFELRGGSGAV
jgi:HEPN domain-containing protein